ncbi:MAG: lytic transglycosylase domain-containing protein [Bacteroidota bacterium]
MNISKGVLLLLFLTLFLNNINTRANTTTTLNFTHLSRGGDDENAEIAEEDFSKSWEANAFTIDANYNKQVKKYVKKFLGKERVGMELLLGRKTTYFPIFEKYIQENNLPKELKYLPIVESALMPTIESPVGAKGLWQFMPATARRYGLVIDDYVDERCDPVKSTQAALAYLKFLNDKYQDWKLALAAYNCGYGRVDKAIKKSGKNSFEEIKDFLPKETRQYVPKFIATAYVMENYFFHDLRPIYPEYTMQFVKVVKIHQRTTLAKIAEKTKMSLKTIQKLNPSYRKGIIPPSADGNFVIIPIFSEELTMED